MKKLMLHTTKRILSGALLGASLCLANSSGAQNTKSYSGEFKAGGCGSSIRLDLFKGNASYSYYENEDLERTYDGKFTYTGKQNKSTWDGKSTGESTTVTINGTYKDHLRNGAFISKTSFKSPGFSGTSTCTANYLKGLANGLWSIAESGESTSVTFKNNVGVGAFKYKTKELTITGELNNEGYFNGEVKFKDRLSESIMTYDNGFQMKFIIRNTQTGELSKKLDTKEDEVKYYKEIITAIANNNTEALENIPYKLEIHYHYGVYDNFNNGFKVYNFPGATPGDLSASQDYNHNYQWKAFMIKTLVPQETRDERMEREKKEQEAKIRKEINRLIGGYGTPNFDEASKIYNDQEVFTDNQLHQKILNGLAQQAMQKSDKALDESYAVLDVIKTAYKGKNVYKFKKKKLYDSYRKLHTEYIKKINQSDDYEVKNNFLEKAKALSDRVILLIDTETKDLEKSLKSATTTEQIEELLK